MKRKSLILTLAILAFILILSIPNMVKAEETGSDIIAIERTILGNDGSFKFKFSGLSLDADNKEYVFGLTKTKAEKVEQWIDILDYTENTATLNIMTTNANFRKVINTVDTGYITIKEKDTDTLALKPSAVDLKTPFLSLTNYTVIPNGKNLNEANIELALRNAYNSKSYYQYEKITDEAVIKKYKEIKSNNGDYKQLQTMLKSTVPTSNWITWDYWNGHDISGMEGFGYPKRSINLSDSGLYYMWIYNSGANLKEIYGYILVDNLQPEIALERISLSATSSVELGKNITLYPIFSPTNATNKIVTWSSSDESVATVDNAGKVTPKKIGSTIITVTSKEGNKKATCTVTVTGKSTSGTGTENVGTGNSVTSGNQGTSSTTGTKKDPTTATGKMPQTGIYSTIVVAIIAVAGIGIVAFKKYRNLRDI